MTRNRAELGELERQVLQIAWKSGDVMAEQVRDALKRPLKESTVRTVLSRLERKGYLTHTVAQRTFVYRVAKPPAHMAAKAVQRIADWFCNGSVDDVLVGMVESKLLDRRGLQRLLEKMEKAKPGGK